MSEMNAVYNVKQYILNLIKQNKLEYGDQLPSNLSIARELNVKTDDVYEAIQALITEQVIILLEQPQSKETFINDIQKVSREDIVSVAEKAFLDTIYVLTKGGDK
ncbi:hypothetical protein HMPREF3248_04295 [Staphylococcus aureus]|nr:hypothetical protein HMPREF3248_04295 [Staphylococcus aureus]